MLLEKRNDFDNVCFQKEHLDLDQQDKQTDRITCMHLILFFRLFPYCTSFLLEVRGDFITCTTAHCQRVIDVSFFITI